MSESTKSRKEFAGSGRNSRDGRHLASATLIAAFASALVLVWGGDTSAEGSSEGWVRPAEIRVESPEVGHSTRVLEEIFDGPVKLRPPPILDVPEVIAERLNHFSRGGKTGEGIPAVQLSAPEVRALRLAESLAPSALPEPPEVRLPPIAAPEKE